MKERALFDAHGLEHDDEGADITSEPWHAYEEIDPGNVVRDRVRCLEDGCPVMIATWANRRICRYHQGKRDALSPK